MIYLRRGKYDWSSPVRASFPVVVRCILLGGRTLQRELTPIHCSAFLFRRQSLPRHRTSGPTGGRECALQGPSLLASCRGGIRITRGRVCVLPYMGASPSTPR